MNRFWLRAEALLLGVAAAVPAPAASPAVPATGRFAIEHVAVVDVENGCLRGDQTVVWDRSRIAIVGPAATVEVPDDAVRISGVGEFLLPGLWDMHVHVRPEFGGAEIALPMFIANGITSVREMGETPDPQHPFETAFAAKHTWSEEAIAGLRVGPRILAVGSLHVDGARLLRGKNPRFFATTTPEDARRLVHYIKDETGADFIKVYSGIQRDAFFALMDEARRLGMVVCGHKPLSVSFIEAADAGFRSMEHAREMLLDSFPGAADLQHTNTERNLPPARLRLILEQQDPRMLQAIFAAMTRNGAYYCPTHTTRKFDAFAGDFAYTHDPRIRYIPAAVQAAWSADVADTLKKGPTAEDKATYLEFYRRGLAVTAAAHAAGVKILAGTDAGDSYCFYGGSLLDELGNLVDGGLSPAEALRAATVTPAEYFHRQADLGTVAAGKIADLVLLDANPLVNIGNVHRTAGVVFNGHFYNREALDGIRAEVARIAQAGR